MTLSTEIVGQKLVGILTEYLENNADPDVTYPAVTPATNMVTELQLDSIQIVEFMLEVEDQFDFIMDLESQSNVHTINDLAAVIIDRSS